jgi:hypothetical protein
MKMARFAVAAGALLFVAMATSASAAVRPVDIVGFKFEPQSVTITAGGHGHVDQQGRRGAQRASQRSRDHRGSHAGEKRVPDLHKCRDVPL